MANKPKTKVSPQAKGRMAKAGRDQSEAARKISDRVLTQSWVQEREHRAANMSDAKKAGKSAAVPSPSYWGAGKKKENARTKAANSAYGSYRGMAKKGK